MDNAFITILFMAIVGAAIGGFTNYLAIKMLFRPYNAIYIKNWRLPFTPGLVPKRRQELSRQIGLTVKNYLLTPEVFQKKLFNEEIQASALKFAQKKTQEIIFTEEKTIYDWLKLGGFGEVPSTVEHKIDSIIEKQFDSVKNVLTSKSLEELLPNDIQQSIDRKIPEMVAYILEKGEDYFLSPQGEMTIRNMMDDFLGSKGSFGGMIQMLVGDSTSIVSKIQRELVHFMKAPGTKTLLVNLFSQEWDKLKQQSAMNFLADVDFDSILHNIQSYAKTELNLRERLNKPISYYWPQGTDYMNHDLLPKLVNKGFDQAQNKLEEVLNRLSLDEVVREQVDSFPLEKLEELVVGIASKELKMITILGAVLGGVIGIFQGLIVFIFN